MANGYFWLILQTYACVCVSIYPPPFRSLQLRLALTALRNLQSPPDPLSLLQFRKVRATSPRLHLQSFAGRAEPDKRLSRAEPRWGQRRRRRQRGRPGAPEGSEQRADPPVPVGCRGAATPTELQSPRWGEGLLTESRPVVGRLV